MDFELQCGEFMGFSLLGSIGFVLVVLNLFGFEVFRCIESKKIGRIRGKLLCFLIVLYGFHGLNFKTLLENVFFFLC